jgi:hypothetical protein
MPHHFVIEGKSEVADLRKNPFDDGINVVFGSGARDAVQYILRIEGRDLTRYLVVKPRSGHAVEGYDAVAAQGMGTLYLPHDVVRLINSLLLFGQRLGIKAVPFVRPSTEIVKGFSVERMIAPEAESQAAQIFLHGNLPNGDGINGLREGAECEMQE